jgi:nitrate reductase gamma subunit
MAVGGVFGLVCFLGLTLLIYRRLTDPRIRATSSVMDIVILLLLYVQLILGLSTIFVSARHLDGGEMLMLSGWAQHLVTLRPDAASLIAGVPLIYKLHILLGLTIFLVFPFSRLVHIWSAPVSYVGRRYQIVRRRGGADAARGR